ncbi:pilus assembly protein [Burkholderia guangdongensis]|uniref:pilus assembly protein n=1 Tax=Burkholderia guangdongensis TaxID=1792500 RepID=UPI001FEB4ED0|nr:pilus assembly protein [Burkholderia guangdongensis]
MTAMTADWAWLVGVRWRGARCVVGRAAGYAVAFGAVFAGGASLADQADWSGLAQSRAALDAAAARAAAADRVLAEAARRKPDVSAAASTDAGRAPDWATLALKLAELAASSGLRLDVLEPQPAQPAQPAQQEQQEPREQQAQPGARRAVRIVARGDFPALRRTVGGLAALPALAVPMTTRVERGAAALRIEMTLDVFPALPVDGAASAGDQIDAFADAGDPFGRGVDDPGETDAASARLAGVLRDGRGGLALFDDGTGSITAISTGEALGHARLLRVAPDGVVLATPGGPRRIDLDEGSPS